MRRNRALASIAAVLALGGCAADPPQRAAGLVSPRAADCTASGMLGADAAEPISDPMSPSFMIDVQATGSIPAVADQNIRQYIAAQMAAVHPGTWQFEAGSAAAACARNEVEWSFEARPSAAGTVKEIVSPRGYAVIGEHDQWMRVKARLFLNGSMRRVVSGTSTRRDLGTLVGAP